MKKKFAYLALAAIIILHLVFVLPSAINKMFYGDEVAFIECARSVIQTGQLTYTHGQEFPNAMCLWHPPMYIYLLSLSLRFFGENPLSLRLISILFNALTIILVFKITQEVIREEKNKYLWPLLAALIYALNPLVIQGAMIIEIDCGLLNFLMSLFVYLYLKNKNYFYLGVSLFLVAWAKTPGVIILFASFFILFFINREWKKMINFIFLFTVTGAIFLVSFWFFTHWMNLNFFMPFTHNSIFRILSEVINNGTASVARSVWALKTFVYFVTPFFCLLFLYAMFFSIKEKKENKNISILWIIPVFSVILYFITASTAWNFPKYYVVGLPYASALICYVISKKIHDLSFINKKLIFQAILASLLGILVVFIFSHDPIIPEVIGTAVTTSFLEAGKAVILRLLSYFILPLVFFFPILFLLSKEKRIPMVLAFLAVLFFIYLDIIQLTASYSTGYMYGNSGLKEISDYTKKENISAESLATYPNLGYYIGFKKFLDVALVYDSSTDFKKWIVDNEKIKYLIILEKDIKRIGKNMYYFSFREKIGDYFIYTKDENGT